ncbi:MAG: hypothetical protein AAFP19_18465 [Bacteroidota bacterium]
MKNTLLLLLICCCGLTTEAWSQSFFFGLKGGPSLGVQNWNGFERDPLFKYHVTSFIETAQEDARFALFAQLGYHLKGSAIRNRNFFNPINGQTFRPPPQEFIFRNIVLSVGAKRKYQLNNSMVYYMLGIRGDYTVSTNLDEFNTAFNSVFTTFPQPDGVQEFNYGVIIGGGIEFPITEFIGAMVELTVNPDFSRQYRQPPAQNVYDPFTGNNITISEREITNNTVELSIGFRFLRKVEYIED